MVEAAGGRSSAAAMKKKPVMSNKPEKDGSGRRLSSRTSHRQCREPAESPSYRLALKSIFSCRNSGQQQHPAPAPEKLACCKLNDSRRQRMAEETAGKRRASVSGGSSASERKPLGELPPSSSKQQLQLQRGGSSSSFRGGMQLRQLSGCYECHMVVDPVSGGSSSMRATTCPDCGEIFVRQESLQLHQSISHAVSELGSDDTSRNIIEIIFQSSWLKKQSPVCQVERILKVHNTARTLARFEEYRDAVKAKAARAQQQQANTSTKHPRCSADGNELLRFHCATLACALGLDGATHLCDAAATGCGACAIIRDGFRNDGGVRTMATSGRAHDDADADQGLEERRRRAMLVCRVIAGRVKRRPTTTITKEGEAADEHDGDESSEEEFESVAGSAGLYSNLEELQVFNPRAILPCFVVAYNCKALA